MGVKKKASFGGKCKVCDKSYTTNDEVCMQKDGENWIICIDEKCFKQQGGTLDAPKAKGQFVASKHKLETHSAIFEMAEGLLAKFYEKRKEKVISEVGEEGYQKILLDGGIMLTVEQEAQVIESFFKTLSGSYKP